MDKNYTCEMCREVTLESNWAFLVRMCKPCDEDRSRWKCQSCGDNLRLKKPPYQDDFRPWKHYCDECVEENKNTQYATGGVVSKEVIKQLIDRD